MSGGNFREDYLVSDAMQLANEFYPDLARDNSMPDPYDVSDFVNDYLVDPNEPEPEAEDASMDRDLGGTTSSDNPAADFPDLPGAGGGGSGASGDPQRSDAQLSSLNKRRERNRRAQHAFRNRQKVRYVVELSKLKMP